jgi:hypothetical protein
MILKRFNEFAPETINESAVKTMDTGGKLVWLNHGAEKTRVILQTARLRLAGGVRCFDPTETGGSGPLKYTMELALTPNDAEYDRLKRFDERILDMAVAAGKRWINVKYHDRMNLENMYKTALRIPTDEQGNPSQRWPPTFRITVPHTGNGQVLVYDTSRNEIPLGDFIKNSDGADVTVIVACTGVWITGTGFGTSWKAQQILVHGLSSGALRPFAFMDAPPAPEAPALPPPATVAAPPAAESSAPVDFIEDGEDMYAP